MTTITEINMAVELLRLAWSRASSLACISCSCSIWEYRSSRLLNSCSFCRLEMLST